MSRVRRHERSRKFKDRSVPVPLNQLLDARSAGEFIAVIKDPENGEVIIEVPLYLMDRPDAVELHIEFRPLRKKFQPPKEVEE